ncbi:hypothetical protein [Halomarina rubra]|uniref:Uncharacterized protein n=1 Tax=Halomarina rubra TaxID=2071873 RepID=A0ABD6B0C7_9EURY|nr:hypothetical protein [Halomarina rubra]
MADHVLLGGSSNGRRKLHAPDPDDPDDSLCRFSGNYSRKDPAAVAHHFEWCSYCRVLTEGSRNA